MKSVLAPAKTDLLGLSPEKMQEFVQELDEKSFRGTQVIKWLHQQNIVDFDKMTNLSKDFITKLKTNTLLEIPTIVADKAAFDGTRKWLMQLSDGNKIESVYIPTLKRSTLCVSTQVGCSLNCSFCFTAVQGYNRNLTAGEIISQLWLANKVLLSEGKKPVTNVVLMGMGEPLLNFDASVSALKLMLNDNAYGLSRRKVTLSTSGIVPMIYQLKQSVSVSLAVSLHASNDEMRNKLVPINQKYPLAQLIKACKDYTNGNIKSHVTFEYVMLKGVNDQIKDARQLINLIQNVPNKVNLIPFNGFAGSQYQSSSMSTIENFQNKLISAGINARIRRTRGDDIYAACGQLAGQIKDKTRRSSKILA